MFVKFEKIRYKNLLSTGNLFTEIDLNKNSNTLIVGDNGAGKSTIIEAISFALFNKSYRGLTKPELVNSITRKHLVCECDFIISGEQYMVRRGINPNLFEIYKNGDLIEQTAAVRDYQTYFEKHILKVNYKTFSQCVILGTSSYCPFMKLPAQGRREVVEDILDLEIFSIMNSLLKSKMQTNEINIAKYDTEKKMLQKQIDLLIKQRNTATKKKEEDLNKLKADMAKYNKDIKTISQNISKLQSTITDEKEIRNKYEELKEYQNQFKRKKAKLYEEVQFYEETDTCPTCTQHINEDFKEKVIKEKETDISQFQEGLRKVTQKVDRYSERIFSIEQTKNQINDLKVNMARWKGIVLQIKGNIDNLEKEQEQVNEDDLNKLKFDLDLCDRKTKELYDEKKNYDMTAVMLKDSGIKANIIKQYIPVVNKLINKYLSLLDFYVNFELDENFNETILSRYRDNFSYASFSEGERYRINLAILFTWRAIAKMRGSFSTNILFLDEVMDSSLDSSGTEEFLKIVQADDEHSNVFIISHKVDQLYDKFANIIKFEKVNNFSSMKEL